MTTTTQGAFDRLADVSAETIQPIAPAFRRAAQRGENASTAQHQEKDKVSRWIKLIKEDVVKPCPTTGSRYRRGKKI